MNGFPTAADIERIAKENGRTMKTVCALAGIAESTFQRFKGGSDPKQLTVRRLQFAAETGRSYTEMDGINA